MTLLFFSWLAGTGTLAGTPLDLRAWTGIYLEWQAITISEWQSGTGKPCSLSAYA